MHRHPVLSLRGLEQSSQLRVLRCDPRLLRPLLLAPRVVASRPVVVAVVEVVVVQERRRQPARVGRHGTRVVVISRVWTGNDARVKSNNIERSHLDEILHLYDSVSILLYGTYVFTNTRDTTLTSEIIVLDLIPAGPATGPRLHALEGRAQLVVK